MTPLQHSLPTGTTRSQARLRISPFQAISLTSWTLRTRLSFIAPNRRYTQMKLLEFREGEEDRRTAEGATQPRRFIRLIVQRPKGSSS